MPDTEPQRSVHRRTEQPVYAELAASKEFAQLRRRYRGFVFPWTVAFLVWYLLYVVMSMWAHDFMSIKLIGNINVALVFGLSQFVTTFVIARLYATHAQKSLDPLAEELEQRYRKAVK
jgi:uncharacterized membrane protein (DUF485 family)